jgi:hypothetical protein
LDWRKGISSCTLNILLANVSIDVHSCNGIKLNLLVKCPN